MATPPAPDESYKKIIAKNKRAHFEYTIEDKIEAGIILTGSEVKSLRLGKAMIADAFADSDGKDLYLHNAHIAIYNEANRWNHQEKRVRKLLLHKREVQKLIGKLKIKGMTIIPLSMYFNHRNKVKVELGVAKGKKAHDKRETQKKRDWQRQKNRLLKGDNQK